MFRDGFGSVMGTGRIETAPRAKQWGYTYLVPPNQQQDDPGADPLPLHALI